jgi:acyl-CoA dehydrogenase
MADLIIVCAKTDPTAKGSKSISLVLVEAGMPGFTRGKKLNKLGLKAQDTSELFFDDVLIPKENILGELNNGFGMLMKEV